MTKCTICDKEYQNIGAHMKAHETVEEAKDPLPTVAAQVVPQGPTSDSDKMMELMQTVTGMLGDVQKRLNKIETGGAMDFKEKAKAEDIQAAKQGREDVDPRLVKIVDEMLGEDFGVQVTGHDDKPGFLFTVIVPQRLSGMEKSLRPVKDEDGTYKKTASGETVMEEYYPEDRRSREISSTQSFEVIKQHCERVRANIVGYYQKTNRPLPEFRVK